MIFDKAKISENCEEFFSLYNEFSENRDKIYDMCQRKKFHTRRVAENCIFIASHMGLDDYDCSLAWIIGELHDFARFGQAVVTETFVDSERFHHARLGARLLFTHGMIEDIIPNYDEVSEEDKIIMEKAVYYHSDYALPEGLTDREELFCKIVRDADKVDIFRTVTEDSFEAIYRCSKEDIMKSDISEPVEEAFLRHVTVNNKYRITYADRWLSHIALCFGLEYESSKQRAIDEGYLLTMLEIEFLNPEVQNRYLRMKSNVKEFLGLK
ncbi:MAG: HD domain-containing protein [Synergistaceae bacterium]|nr:HD domain-containing protein [Synergistaceae bacterium]MBQ3693374.1 HD domain-containing protein [Synergistaceae bacterium]MBQ9628435.1 HD domain-containing protein [Synergistaceae bacterium]